MSTATLEQPTATEPKPGRETNGRFAKGNAGGSGNPFGRRLAALREAIFRVVNEEVIENIFAMLMKKAREGDLAATKLLLQFSVGTPKPMVEPDRIDIEEWGLNEESWVEASGCTQMMTTGVPVALANAMNDAVAAARTKNLGEMLVDPSKIPTVVAPIENDEDDLDTPLTPEEVALAKKEWVEFHARYAAEQAALEAADRPSPTETNGDFGPSPAVNHHDKRREPSSPAAPSSRAARTVDRPSPTATNGSATTASMKRDPIG